MLSFDQISTWVQSLPRESLVLAAYGATLVLLVVLGRWGLSALVHWLMARRRAARVMRAWRDSSRPSMSKWSWLGKQHIPMLTLLPFAVIVLLLVIGVDQFRDNAPSLNGGSSQAFAGDVLVGRVTHVRDGDTIVVRGRPIRLNGLTCDEIGTALGDQATRAMRRLVSGKTLTCTLNGERTYDREVGRCKLRDGRDIGAIMIASGLCGRCARYDPFRLYAQVQREAGPFKGTYPGYCQPR